MFIHHWLQPLLAMQLDYRAMLVYTPVAQEELLSPTSLQLYRHLWYNVIPHGLLITLHIFDLSYLDRHQEYYNVYTEIVCFLVLCLVFLCYWDQSATLVHLWKDHVKTTTPFAACVYRHAQMRSSGIRRIKWPVFRDGLSRAWLIWL